MISNTVPTPVNNINSLCISSKSIFCSSAFCKRLSGVELQADCKSSQSILFVTTLSFFLFTVALWFGAILSHSLSLKADATAMSVDVVTYFVNMFAETLKTNSKDGVLSAHTRFKLEVCVPIVSCLALLASGSWIAYEAFGMYVWTRVCSLMKCHSYPTDLVAKRRMKNNNLISAYLLTPISSARFPLSQWSSCLPKNKRRNPTKTP